MDEYCGLPPAAEKKKGFSLFRSLSLF